MRFEVLSLSPERPSPGSWLAFVLLGLIGLFLGGATVNASVGPLEPTEHLIWISGLFLGAYALTNAYYEASALDELEGSR